MQVGVPDDVAALFRWAGLQGMPYRSFSSAVADPAEAFEESYAPSEVAESQSAAERTKRPGDAALEAASAEDPRSHQQLPVAAPAGEGPREGREPDRGTAVQSEIEGTGQSASDVEGMLPMRVPQRRSGRFWPSGLREHELPGTGRAGRAGDSTWAPRKTEDGVPRQAAQTSSAPAASLGTVADHRAANQRAADHRAANQRIAIQTKGKSAEAAPGAGGGVSVQETTSTSAVPSWIARGSLQTHRTTPRATESLQTSRERVAGRWYALRGLLAAAAPQPQGAEVETAETSLPPVLVIHSVAGGVGKTSLAASLTRALAAQGERVLLVDMTGHGVLPFFFGARELRSQEKRTFSPPPGTLDKAIQLVTFAAAHGAGELSAVPPPNAASAGGAEPLQAPSWADRLRDYSRGFTRVVVDLPPERGQDLPLLLEGQGRLLVPLAPELSSVLSLRALRQRLMPVPQPAAAPAFLLMQYDPAERLHLDMRELLVQELGEALLPIAVRRSPLVSEALAQGMTVIDYAPEQEVAQDLREIAGWVRTTMEPHEDGTGQARWIER